MDKSVQALVAVAAIVVIGAGGLYVWNDQERRHQEQQRADAADARRHAQQAKDCLPVVAAYDRDDFGPAKARYGRLHEEAIRACRVVIETARNQGLLFD